MGDRVKAWRAKRIVKLWEDVKKRLGEQEITEPELPNPKIALPILAAAADENREELQDLWARLLAAAMHPAQAKQVRLGFAEALQKLDPLDALIMRWMRQHGGSADMGYRNKMAEKLNVTRDEVDVSLENLVRQGFASDPHGVATTLAPFGREFLRTVWE